MFVIDERDLAYRSGNSGPKYLMKGPRMNFALMRLQPGEDFRAHYHQVMEENFYILEGEVDIEVNGQAQHLTPGQFIHIEPGEVHHIVNHSDAAVQMIATLAPYTDPDKVEV